MKKIIEWLKDSNRWKHIVGGIIIGGLANDIYCASLLGIGVSSALEFKDKQWGGTWDWIDWSLTVSGVAVGYIMRYLFLLI